MVTLNYQSADLPRGRWWKRYLVGIPLVAILYVAVVLFYIRVNVGIFHHRSAAFEAIFSYPSFPLLDKAVNVTWLHWIVG
jgi:hypothetical protein